MIVELKELGFERYNIMRRIMNEAFELGVTIYPGAWGTPSTKMAF